MSRCSWAVLLFLLAGTQAAHSSAAEHPRLIVLNIQATTRIAKDIVKTLNEIQLSSFQQTGRVEVLGFSDITNVMHLEEQKVRLTQCSDDSCLAEVGGALGARYLASSQLGSVGNQYVISIKVVDVSSVKVIGRVSKTIPKDDDRLIEAIQAAVAELRKRTDRILNPTAAGPPVPVKETFEEPSAPVHWASWVTLGVGLAVTGAGATFGILAQKDEETANNSFEGTQAWQSAHDAMESKALAADILFGVGAATLVTAAVFFFVLDGEPESGLALLPLSGGAAACYTSRF